MRKRLAAALIALTMLVSGCASVSVDYSEYAPDASERLVIYTSHKPEVYSPIIAEFEKRTGIWVTVVDGGTGELLDRIADESKSGVFECDVMFGGGVESLDSCRDYFEPYKSSELENVSPLFRSTGGEWTPFSSLPLVFVYNPKLVSENSFTGWRDLIDPRWKGKIAFADPSVSGSSYTALYTMLRILGGGDRTISLFYNNLDSRQLSSSADVVQSVADGTFLFGVTLEETALKRINDGENIQMLYPSEGTSAVPDAAALIKGAQNSKNAALFLDFILSRDVQSLIADSFSRRSVRFDVPSAALLVPENELSIINYDISQAGAKRESILAYWTGLGEGGAQ